MRISRLSWVLRCEQLPIEESIKTSSSRSKYDDIVEV